MSVIISREEAESNGLSRYFTGKPCKHGHVAERRIGDGHCVECKRLKQDLWRSENREKARSIVKASEFKRKSHNPDEYYAAKRAAFAKWAKANPDLRKALCREQKRLARLLNPEREKETSRRARRKRMANQPEIVRAEKSAQKAARRAKQFQSGGSHTPSDVQDIRRLQKNRCALCAINLRRIKSHVDHIMPLALGGSNGRRNLQILCEACNLSKGAKHPIVFANSLGLLV